MIKREDYDKYMDYFEKQFDKKLGKTRKELLYRRISSFLDAKVFGECLVSVIERFNSNELPSVDVIADMAMDEMALNEKIKKDQIKEKS